MNVLFEDDGQLKAGTVLADNDASLQVEAVSGKRLKIKAANVLLRFDIPGPGAALTQAQQLLRELEPAFLWEVVDDAEFGFAELAREYYGRAPAPAEATAVALLLQAAPMYFYKKGKGRYRRAPPDALRSALASIERKQREAAEVATWVDQLGKGVLPEAFQAKLSMLLYRPDKNALEWKALRAAADEQKCQPVDLLAACGAIPSTHEYHFKHFVTEVFPEGTVFPAWGTLPSLPALPLASVAAFTIDDAQTIEIDDAFSVRPLANGNWEIGIHIACPALAIPRGSAADAIARRRLSTIYMPGRKLTMLPEALIDAFSLREGTQPPALSLYVETTPDGQPLRHETRVNRVPIVANLRLPHIAGAFANALPDPADPPFTAELRTLWLCAQRLFEKRGKADFNRIDYGFDIDWDAAPDGVVRIVPRERGSPLDKLVAELMIHVNDTWGALLAQHDATGLYRVQSAGKVKMSTRPGEHQGLGLAHYLWSSSPLRRYSDLVNQRQLLAVVAGSDPPYAPNDPELYATLADFEATYSQYAEFQDRMEQYWCLRWLLQERVGETTATVIRENLVRFDRLPLVQRLPDLPPQPPATAVRVGIGAVDLLNVTFECRNLGTLE